MTNEITCSEVIQRNQLEYGIDLSKTMFPNEIDGLKDGQRRAIYVSGGLKGTEKMLILIGEITKFHNHGDQPIYETVVRMSQPWNNEITFFDVVGSIGSYQGEDASAPRYLDISCSDFSKALFYQNVDMSSLPTRFNPAAKQYEPAYFIPRLPLAMFIGSYAIGVGFRTDTPFLAFNSVCQMVMDYAKLKMDGIVNCSNQFKNFAEYLIYDSRARGLLRNVKELRRHYRSGDFSSPKMLTDGVIMVSPTTISIMSAPVGGLSMSTIFKKIKEQLNLKDSPFSKFFRYVTDLDSKTKADYFHGDYDVSSDGNIELTLRQKVDPFEVLPILIRTLRLTSHWSPTMEYSSVDGRLVVRNQYQLLERWYSERIRSIKIALSSENEQLTRENRQLKAKILIVDHYEEITAICCEGGTIPETVDKLCVAFKQEELTPYQAEYIISLNLSHMLKEGREKLTAEYQNNLAKRKIIFDKLQHIHQVIYDDAKSLQQTFGKRTQRNLEIPNFRGVLVINRRNYIQFINYEELISLMNIWCNEALEVILYPSGSHHLYFVPIGKDAWEDTDEIDLPRHFTLRNSECQLGFKPMKYRAKAVIGLSETTMLRCHGLRTLLEDNLRMLPVSDRITVIDKKWRVQSIPASEVVLRKTVKATGNLTNYRYFDNVVGPQVVIVTAAASEQNQIYIHRVKMGESLHHPLLGETIILGVYPDGEDIIVSIPTSCLNRCTTQHLLLYGNNIPNRAVVNVNRSSTEYSVSRYSKYCKHLFQLKFKN